MAKTNENQNGEPEFPFEVKSGSVVVKIYKVTNKDRDSYTISYFCGKKRKQKMFSDFEAAKRYAKAVGKTLSIGELDVLELRSSDRISYVHAVEALRPINVPLEIAAKEYAEAWRLLGGRASLVEAAREYVKRNMHQLPSKLVPEAVKEMLTAKEQEGASKAYMKVLSLYLKRFAETIGSPVRSLTTAEVADFLRNLKGIKRKGKGKTEVRPISMRSRNNARQTLGAFFRFCKERGWLPRDHEGIELLPKFKEKTGDIAVFTPWEMSQLLKYAREELVPFLAIGAFAGLRSAEIERLDWSEVHLADRFIEVTAEKAKTASRRVVPILDNLAKWLSDHVEENGRVVPFDNMAKQIGWLVKKVNKELKKVAKEAGKDPEKIKLVKWKKNALRHSFISYRVADIQNTNQVALECGNSPAIIFKHYRELVRPADAKKWFSIEPTAIENVIVMPAVTEAQAMPGFALPRRCRAIDRAGAQETTR
jgi:integrase